MLGGTLHIETCLLYSRECSIVLTFLKTRYKLSRNWLTQNEPIDTLRIPMQVGNTAPFKVTIKPRSEAHAALIRRECKGVADELANIARDQPYLKATL